jgi:hypothetical protein
MAGAVKCARCGEEFEPAWDEGEALAEMRATFGDLAVDNRVLVCDDCYVALGLGPLRN